jgi:rare lipoprotein A
LAILATFGGGCSSSSPPDESRHPRSSCTVPAHPVTTPALKTQTTPLAVLAIALAVASPVAAQDWSLFGKDDGPARGAPVSPRSWHVTIQRAAHEFPPVAATDPRWTATVTYSKVPLLAANPIPRAAPRAINPATGKSHTLEGIASYYWQEQTTASGERFDKTALTAAHKTLPLQSRVRVTNVVNGRSVVVRINDRGPFKPGRVIDLSEAAAHHLDMQRLGLVPVKLQIISN